MPIIFNISAVSLIFAAARLTCHSTSSRRVCLPPLLSHACVRVAGDGFELDRGYM